MPMNKRTITLGAVGGMTIGGVLPMLFGDYNSFDMWAVLGGLVGGIIGIWAAVFVSKRIGI